MKIKVDMSSLQKAMRRGFGCASAKHQLMSLGRLEATESGQVILSSSNIISEAAYILDAHVEEPGVVTIDAALLQSLQKDTKEDFVWLQYNSDDPRALVVNWGEGKRKAASARLLLTGEQGNQGNYEHSAHSAVSLNYTGKIHERFQALNECSGGALKLLARADVEQFVAGVVKASIAMGAEMLGGCFLSQGYDVHPCLASTNGKIAAYCELDGVVLEDVFSEPVFIPAHVVSMIATIVERDTELLIVQEQDDFYLYMPGIFYIRFSMEAHSNPSIVSLFAEHASLEPMAVMATPEMRNFMSLARAVKNKVNTSIDFNFTQDQNLVMRYAHGEAVIVKGMSQAQVLSGGARKVMASLDYVSDMLSYFAQSSAVYLIMKESPQAPMLFASEEQPLHKFIVAPIAGE
jgi:hypothetical protein